MGWTYCDKWKTKAQAVNALLTEERRPIHHALKADVVYTVETARNSSGRKIYVHLLEKEGGSWGFKTMSESEMPYYFECPTRLLKLAGPPDTDDAGAVEWRKHVFEGKRRKPSTLRLSDLERIFQA